MAPTTRNQLASCFIVPPSAPQYTPLALPLSSGTYFSGRSSEKHPENCVANWKDLDNYHQRTTVSPDMSLLPDSLIQTTNVIAKLNFVNRLLVFKLLMSIKTDVCGLFPLCLSVPFQPMYSQYSQ